MFTLFVIGNIASGKSTAVRYLARQGARIIDLDQVAKDLYVPGSAVVNELRDAFGSAILDAAGAIRPKVLADHAFATKDDARRLNEIVLPRVHERLTAMLMPSCCTVAMPSNCRLIVVEISLAASFTYAFPLADEVMAITAPVEMRRRRAIERGMDGEDFDNRAALQPTEEELCALASVVIDNTAADDTLFSALDAWLEQHGLQADQPSLGLADAQ